MNDEEVVERVRREGQDGSAIEVAELLGRLIPGGLTQGSLVTYFKRAFPAIPLRVLSEASGWHRVSGGGIGDAQFEERLRAWIPSPGSTSSHPVTWSPMILRLAKAVSAAVSETYGVSVPPEAVMEGLERLLLPPRDLLRCWSEGLLSRREVAVAIADRVFVASVKPAERWTNDQHDRFLELVRSHLAEILDATRSGRSQP